MFARRHELIDVLVKGLRTRPTGFSTHYLTLFSMVVGMRAQQTLEFGAGLSTEVFLAAHRITGGQHRSVDRVKPSITLDRGDRWGHYLQDSRTLHPGSFRDLVFDVVLHDGAHDAETVEQDLRLVIPHIRRNGLLLVHDTLHSDVGKGIRLALGVLRLAPDWVLEDDFERLTLPYGFGLTIYRRVAGGYPSQAPDAPKTGSPATTTWAEW